MEPSPLHFVSHTHYYRGGDIVIDESAAIAPGVVFRASPGASIRVGPGVCIGAGVVIQAKKGCVFIESGASLGTGVLVVGHGHIGKDACIGPSSTLMNPAVAANEIIPPCSLLSSSSSQPSNQGASTPHQESGTTFHTPNFQSQDGPVPSVPITPRTSPTVQPQAVSPKPVDVPDLGPTAAAHQNGSGETFNQGNGTHSTSAAPSAVVAQNHDVYGRDHLNSLLSALFPHRQPLNNGNTGGES
ncbi:LbetaH domain-containing protein [Leptothoe kymatousa]|uniref:Dynactin subunit 6 n=1 Tax=Leptothoe kymatousa TAU-MAC 1615 TaxID=2364775 RepID=A0ABS5Y0F3_9CYAN|nr:hypothetical protein [Leptothoe kymatousa]MBT9311086.1 hypothetical protein [Leptothoe kymatousa TAU-MAC 1615]